MKSLGKIILLNALYLALLLVFNPSTFSYRINEADLIEKYFRSQSITHEVVGKRIFLSDSDVYIATGWLYIHGSDPSIYNFEHPPVSKYLFGLVSLLTQNPLSLQVILGMATITLVYLLANHLYLKNSTALLASMFLILDPLFRTQTQEALLDLSQTTFMLGYVFSMVTGSSWIVQAILLAFFVGTKFWMTPLFFVAGLALYKITKKDFQLTNYLKHILLAVMIYSTFYLASFVTSGLKFNFIWHTLKMTKYWFEHSVASFFGAELVLVMTGWWKTWWGAYSWERAVDWNLLWPIFVILSTWQGIKSLLKKQLNYKTIFALTPILYSLYLGVAAPFARYFLIALPFLYITSSAIIIDAISPHKE